MPHAKKLHIYLEDIANKMVRNLKTHAKKHGVDLKGITIKNFNCEIDNRFKDGGFARNEEFADLGHPYALQFGEFDSKEFHKAHWKAIVKAVGGLRGKL